MLKRTLEKLPLHPGWLFTALLALPALLAACAVPPTLPPVLPAAPTPGMPTPTAAPPMALLTRAVPLAVSPSPVATSTQTPPPFDADSISLPIVCDLEPVAVPTLPAKIPAYLEVDPDTGLHMTGTWQTIRLEDYSLQVTGRVERPLSLAYNELRCLPKVETSRELVCPGYFADFAHWSGASMGAVLELAGVQQGSRYVNLYSADGYVSYVSPEVARSPENLLAYELDGETLPILHGFPIRAVLPGQEGNRWVKWLVKIEVE